MFHKVERSSEIGSDATSAAIIGARAHGVRGGSGQTSRLIPKKRLETLPTTGLEQEWHACLFLAIALMWCFKHVLGHGKWLRMRRMGRLRMKRS